MTVRDGKEPSTIEERGILGEVADANRQLSQSARELCDSLNRLVSPPPMLPPRRRGRWL